MLKNWKLTVKLLTPIIGEPPFLDALLMEEMAFRLGNNSGGEKLTRSTDKRDFKDIPIPLCKKTLNGFDVYRCSDPICKVIYSEMHHHSKRFDCDEAAQLLYPSERKSILTSSGPYKMRYTPELVNTVPQIVYFFRGDRVEVNKLLKAKKYIGKKRNVGYGWVDSYEFDEQEEDLSMVYTVNEENYLMKTIPANHGMGIKFCNARGTFGACVPPYWHPQNQMDIIKPC
jgi:hypothetical protein